MKTTINEAANPKLTRTEVASQSSDRSDYINKSDLISAGWTRSMIIDLLGEPDWYYSERNGRYRIKECLYLKKRVQKVRRSSKFPVQEVKRRLERREVKAKVDAEKRKEYLKEQEKLKQQRELELRRSFPRESEEKIRYVSDRNLENYEESKLGYQNGVGIKSYWQSLGFKVCESAYPEGFIGKNGRIYFVYSSRDIDSGTSRRTPKEVWTRFCSSHRSSKIALAELVKIANRLQKIKKVKDFYLLKDEWIKVNQANLQEGRFVRKEQRICRYCRGDGYDLDGLGCEDCGRTGIYAEYTLYEHRFVIDQREYCFHSYMEPRIISELQGVDLDKYGYPFAKTELPIPPQSVLIDAIKVGFAECGYADSYEKVRNAIESRNQYAYWHSDFFC